MADEYAVWVSAGRRNLAQTPLLRRVIERRGERGLPGVFLSLKGARLSALFVVQWMSLYPSRGDVRFFQELLDVEREALLVGRKATFLIFQAPEERARAEAAYDAWRAVQSTPVPLPPVRVARVEMAGELARVVLAEPERAWNGPQRCRLIELEALEGERVDRTVGEYARVCEAGEWWDWMRLRRLGG
jgi:hypothetical protein